MTYIYTGSFLWSSLNWFKAWSPLWPTYIARLSISSRASGFSGEKLEAAYQYLALSCTPFCLHPKIVNTTPIQNQVFGNRQMPFSFNRNFRTLRYCRLDFSLWWTNSNVKLQKYNLEKPDSVLKKCPFNLNHLLLTTV